MSDDLRMFIAEELKEAFEEGYARGLKKGEIRGTVKSMRVDRKSDQEIIDRLVMLYDLSADEAEEALNVQMFQYEFLSVL